MLFIFYIIVSSCLYYVLEINGFSVNSKNEALNENEIKFNDSEIVKDRGSVMSKHKSQLNIIQSPSDVPNLKSNIFDKMLSNEMLSLKQQLYEKNETNVSRFYITFKNSIATPTLELKQQWPIQKPFSPSDNEHKKANINKVYITNAQKNISTSKIDENYKDDDSKINDSVHSKVLDVRSFAAMPAHHLGRSNNHQCTKRQCTCMKTNPRTTCSFRCSEHTKRTCTQTENYVTVNPQCTKTVMPFTYYYNPYNIYSTLFLGVSTDSSIVYYRPDVINELKLPKHKYSQIKRPSVDNLYLESDDNKYYDEKEYLENENSDEDSSKKAKYQKNKYGKDKPKGPKKVKTVYFIDFKEENPMSDSESESNKLSDGYLQVLDRDKFVQDVVEDLKVYYSDAVIKDCYCSLSSFKFRTENLIIYIPLLTTFVTY